MADIMSERKRERKKGKREREKEGKENTCKVSDTAGEVPIIYRLGKISHFLGKPQTNCNTIFFTAMHFIEVP